MGYKLSPRSYYIYDAYPRLIPFYGVRHWRKPPEEIENESYGHALKNIINILL